MTTKTWNFTLDSQAHSLTVGHKWLSEKQTIVLDGQLLEHISPRSFAIREYLVKGHSLIVIIKEKSLSFADDLFAYDLLVDGVSLTTGERANTSSNTQVCITQIVNEGRRGILVSGRIESGIVHVGDLLRVHNHRSGGIAQVGQIGPDYKHLKEALQGDDVLLLLEGIEEAKIHPGDQLWRGEEKELPKADDGSWEELPERIAPIFHLNYSAGKIASLAFLGIFWIVPVSFINELLNSQVHILYPLGVLLFWYGIVGFMTYREAKHLIKWLRGRSSFLQRQSQTVAQILRRKAEWHSGKYDDYYAYHLQLEFTPAMTKISAGSLKLQAQISEKLYEKLKKNETVNITYATQDPRVFLIEGE